MIYIFITIHTWATFTAKYRYCCHFSTYSTNISFSSVDKALYHCLLLQKVPDGVGVNVKVLPPDIYTRSKWSVPTEPVNLATEDTEDDLTDLPPFSDLDASDGKTVPKSHVSIESEQESPTKPVVKMVKGVHISEESLQTPEKVHTHKVEGLHVTQETEQTIEKQHVKGSGDMYASKETESVEDKKHIKTWADLHASKESEDTSGKFVPKLKMNTDRHASKESQQTEQTIKKPSQFGHVSEMSFGTVDAVPKLKKIEGIYSNMESEFKSFAIAPKRRKVKGASATAESEESDVFRPKIRINEYGHASIESTYEDLDRKRLQRFRERNIHGHSSESSAQKLLYGEKFGSAGFKDESVLQEEAFENEPYELWSDTPIVSYNDDFSCLGMCHLGFRKLN